MEHLVCGLDDYNDINFIQHTRMVKTIEELPDGIYVEVEWEIDSEMDDDAGDGHVTFHLATGEAGDHKFFGTATLCDGEFVEMDEVEYDA